MSRTHPTAVVRLGLLAALALLAAPLAVAEDDEREGEDDASEATGTAALVALSATLAFVPWNAARRVLVKRWARERPRVVRGLTAWHRRLVLPSHMLLGAAAFAAGAYHGWTAEASHPVLWAGVAMMGLLVVGGALLRWTWVPGTVRKAALLLHGQRLVTVLMVALLLGGHALVED